MTDPALKILRSVFGYDSFRGQQHEIIRQVAAGGDALVLMPTGGGKSLCYQIPAMIRNGTGIVVSPLIALMQDQVATLLQAGARAACLNSMLGLDEARGVENRLLQGELDLLYVAPERLLNARMLALLERIDVALFAIDEAHCVSQWGHDFRADYFQLSLLHERFPHIPRIALTATADERTRREIMERLDLSRAQVYIGGFDRPNIRYRIVQKRSAREQLLHFLRGEHAGDAGIVYCLSRRKVEAVADWLKSRGIEALPYHAGMTPELRQRHQRRFLMEEGVVIVATIAFGMGIDKPNVRFVAHLDLPKSLEAYYQETGRAGRDGLPANAWMAYGLQDVITLRQMLDASDADETHKRAEHHKLEAMLGLCEITTCRRKALLHYFGERLEQPCGNCDSCLEPPKTWDGTEAARQALSCVYRTGQRYGVNYLIDVLQGKSTERIRAFGHDQISTFGIGKGLDTAQWRSVFRQLVARDLLSVDLEGHGSLRLTDACRPLLRGEENLLLRKDAKTESTRQRSRETARPADGDERLWQALREKRRAIAGQQGVPPYVIFHDATLMEMVERRPQTRDQLRRLSGMGERKLALYGDDFLETIKEHGERAAAEGDTVSESLTLFRSGLDVEQIAAKRGLKPTTVLGHLAEALHCGMVELREVVKLNEKEIARIEEAIAALPQDQQHRLKPLYEALDGAYDYGILRCVHAAWQKKLER